MGLLWIQVHHEELGVAVTYQSTVVDVKLHGGTLVSHEVQDSNLAIFKRLTIDDDVVLVFLIDLGGKLFSFLSLLECVNQALGVFLVLCLHNVKLAVKANVFDFFLGFSLAVGVMFEEVVDFLGLADTISESFLLLERSFCSQVLLFFHGLVLDDKEGEHGAI